MDLQSSLKSKGKYVTQIIHFKDGVKRTFNGIITSSIKQGQFTKLELKDGRSVLINDSNVLCIEVFSENQNGSVE
jgi:hypothetical protein|tara:strand:+ start:406 stop:630 length:225 start_codon:yes stop_codon:yes gene_type:complete